ncbi:hypothetical protein E1757_27390 [Paenibacillus piri]|uniref:Transposase zinc-binding domain-containing protein n=1 Tax=Paenibacillus piri TaxID=2547395 RepID=A0A4V2ZSH4_9BACL|nr:transposase zinc-binding domain-containing protein [Paenibacillus piri]TDF93214.1 hypothetical protein E1757_27390 [Paenibacillus piri]
MAPFFDIIRNYKIRGTKMFPFLNERSRKFKNCGNAKKGFKLLVCEGCHDMKVIFYRCKGRFCTASSCNETEEWSRVFFPLPSLIEGTRLQQRL